MKSFVLFFAAITGIGVAVVALLLGFSARGTDSADAPPTVTAETDTLNLREEFKLQTGEINSLRQELTAARLARDRAESELRDRDGRIAKLGEQVKALEQQLADAGTVAESRVPEIGVRCPVTGLSVERQAQAKAVFVSLEREERENAERHYRAENEKLSATDIERGKFPQVYHQTPEAWAAQRGRAYDALCAFWGKEMTDKYIADLRSFWNEKAGDGTNLMREVQAAMEHPDIVQALRVLGRRDA